MLLARKRITTKTAKAPVPSLKFRLSKIDLERFTRTNDESIGRSARLNSAHIGVANVWCSENQNTSHVRG